MFSSKLSKHLPRIILCENIINKPSSGPCLDLPARPFCTLRALFLSLSLPPHHVIFSVFPFSFPSRCPLCLPPSMFPLPLLFPHFPFLVFLVLLLCHYVISKPCTGSVLTALSTGQAQNEHLKYIQPQQQGLQCINSILRHMHFSESS